MPAQDKTQWSGGAIRTKQAGRCQKLEAPKAPPSTCQARPAAFVAPDDVHVRACGRLLSPGWERWDKGVALCHVVIALEKSLQVPVCTYILVPREHGCLVSPW